MLAVLVPSRGRPHNLARLVEAIDSTKAGPVTIYTRLDDDDSALADYLQLDLPINVTVGRRVFYGASLNELAKQAAADGATHLAMFGDDVVPETVGWDLLLVGALNDRLGVAYGSDGLEHLHGVDLPTHYVTHVDVYKRLGWLALPTIRHLFLDNVARDVGQALDNFVYLPGVKLTHLHRWNGAAPDDETYREANDKIKRRRDRTAYITWRDGAGYEQARRELGVSR